MSRLSENSGLLQKTTKSMNKNSISNSAIFVMLPHQETFFAKRAQRFAHLANNLKDNQAPLFFTHFCHAQQQSMEYFKDFAIPLSRFAAPTTPPLDCSKFLMLGLYESIVGDFLKRLSHTIVPNQAFLATKTEALNRTQQQKEQWRLWTDNLLNQKLPKQQLAEHLFITGALQIISTLAASQLNVHQLTPQQNNLCPVCSGPHTATLILEHNPQETIKLCSCLYCGTLWQIPHAQCTFCGETQNTSIHTSENMPDGILLEICQTCGSYCKQINQQKNPTSDVFADDITTPLADFLGKTSFHFNDKSFNPFSAKYQS
ncbi:formate dehydrogenase accessory protein FdhE [Bartonella sp. ML70XJBT.G]|uniref:formate dehydrogenase accessory protein FdhE n=1 Tax=Bartonella sp. ML70XJBT.G TaxID=3019093 RepID=UPI002361D4ED|nr:formate dehydrogenase accessory protein FdhE [Bartonella sp. ML70XJBT.G]